MVEIVAVEASVEGVAVDQPLEIVAHAKCLKQLVIIVANLVKFLLNQQMANLFIVVIVLKKWAMEAEVMTEVRDQTLDHQPQQFLKTVHKLKN